MDVPAKLAARVRLFSKGHGRKTDRDDAVSIGLAALQADGLREVVLDDATVTLRLLSDRRQELVVLRTQAICRLHRLLAELTPGGVRRELSAPKAAAVLGRLRPRDEPGRIRRQLAADHLADVRALDRRIKAIGAQIVEVVAATGTTLVGIFGIGPVVAGADPRRGRHGRSVPGQGPLRQLQRRRAHRRVVRRTTTPPALPCWEPAYQPCAAHAAVTQLRHRDSTGRVHYERKLAEGKTRKEALRCLKRRLSDVVYRQLILDHTRTECTTNARA